MSDLREALRPFAACVFDDNGDVTIDTSHLKRDDYLRAKAAFAQPQNDQEAAIDWPAGINRSTLYLVKRFAVALAKKLRLAEEKYGFKDGWSRYDWENECRDHLYQHLEKGDPRDVAAYCAFMWHHGWVTTAPPSSRMRRALEYIVSQQWSENADLDDICTIAAKALRASDNHEESEIGSLREKLSDALAGGLPHRSDCAVSRAPAYEPDACDCGVGTLAEKFESLLRGVVSQFRKKGCECTFPSDSCCGYSAAKTFLDGRAGDNHASETRCQCKACKTISHARDCAVHNEPAMPNGPCDCGHASDGKESDEAGIRVGDRPRSHGESLQQGPDTTSTTGTAIKREANVRDVGNVANPVASFGMLAPHEVPVSSDRKLPSDDLDAPLERWCQPMDCGKHTPRKFLVYFDDPDRGMATFDNEAEARAFFERANVAWNCYLFGTLPLNSASHLDRLRTEAARLGYVLVRGDDRDEITRIRNRIDSHLNDTLCEMEPDYDDSICGFNEAWDIVRKIFDDALQPRAGG